MSTLLRSALAPFLVGSALLHGSAALWLAVHARMEAPIVALERGAATSRARLVLRAAPRATEPARDDAMALGSPRSSELTQRARRALEPPPERVTFEARSAAATIAVEAHHTPTTLPPLERALAAGPPPVPMTAPGRTPLDLERSLTGQEHPVAVVCVSPTADLPTADADLGAADLGAVVTEQPVAVRNPRPDYPSAARASGVEGTVMLLVTVSRTGSALRVTIERSSGSELLDRAAVRAVERWRFTPARRGGAAIEADVRVPVTFRLSDARR